MDKKTAYFNGKIVSADRIKLSPYDLGMLRGYGIFDVMRAKDDRPIMLPEHFRRLEKSAQALRLNLGIDQKGFEKAVRKLLKINGFSDSVVRTVVTGGESPDAISLSEKPTFYILIEKYRGLPSQIYEKGVGVITLEYRRENPQIKSTSYIFSIKNQLLKKRKKAFEIIYVSGGKVLEGSSSNVFMVKKGKIIVPKGGILEGCARKAVIRLCEKKYFLEEREIEVGEFSKAEEIFLTGSGKNIVPVVLLNGKKVGEGKPGRITREVMETYARFLEKF